MDRLPSDIISDILSRLPAESVLECKLVCRNWRCLIRDPWFSIMHLNHLNHPSADSGELGFVALHWDLGTLFFYYFEYKDSETPPIQRVRRLNFTPPKHSLVIGSCHGLIGLDHGSGTFIFNPITKECVRLAASDNKVIVGRRFCYVSSTNEYKVLGIIQTDAEFPQVYIYTLGNGNGWRYIGDFCFGAGPFNDTCFSANGALYWPNDELETIATFDLAEEKLGEHLSPPLLPRGSKWHDHSMGVLDGFLYFAICQYVERHYYDIWLLKKKNDANSLGWIKEFSVADRNFLTVTKSGGALTYDTHHLNIHDTKTSFPERLVMFRNWIHEVFPYQQTFVSLKESGEEEDTETMESVKIEETDEDEEPEYTYY